jgi:pilus assembly protein Flp/PilA
MLFSEIHTTSVSAGVIKMEERQVKTFKNLLHDESGQDLIEYALVAALIALGAIVSMKALATGISGAFSTISSDLTSSVA